MRNTSAVLAVALETSSLTIRRKIPRRVNAFSLSPLSRARTMDKAGFQATCREHGYSALEAEYLYVALNAEQPGFCDSLPADTLARVMRESHAEIAAIKSEVGLREGR